MHPLPVAEIFPLPLAATSQPAPMAPGGHMRVAAGTIVGVEAIAITNGACARGGCGGDGYWISPRNSYRAWGMVHGRCG